MREPDAFADMPPRMKRHQQLALLLVLMALGIAGNYFNVSLFFGVNIIFGSIAAWLALAWLGLPGAVLVAAAAGAYTYVLWDHPYAFVIFVLEVAFVGGLSRLARDRGRESPPVLWLVGLYWLLVGAPLVAVFYWVAIGMPPTQVVLIALKQSLNGILNAALAQLILLGIALVLRRRLSLLLQQFLFSLLLASMLIPALTLLTWQNHSLRASIETDLRDRLLWFGDLARLRIEHNANCVAPTTLHDLEQSLAARLPAAAEPSLAVLSQPERELIPSDVPGLSIAMPGAQPPALMELWREARYRVALPLSAASAEHLAIEVSTTLVIDELHAQIVRLFATLLALSVISALFAQWLSTLLTRPLERLLDTAAQLPERIVAGQPIKPLGPSPVREIEQLAGAVTRMGARLGESFARLQKERDQVARQRTIRSIQAQTLLSLNSEQASEAEAVLQLCRHSEAAIPGARCLVIAPNAVGRLEVMAAPTLDSTTLLGINRRLRAGDPRFAPTRAYERGKALFVSDRKSGLPSRPQHEGSSAAADLTACWCQPILGRDSQVLGVFALLSDSAASPGQLAHELLESGANLAALVFETQRLQQHHQVLVDALSQANTGIVIGRRRGHDDYHISFVNRGFEDLTGYRADEVLGRDCSFLHDQHDDATEDAAIRAALVDGENCRITVRNYRKDGSAFWSALSLAPLRNAKREVSHYVAIMQDVSALQDALEQVSHSESLLKEAQAITHLGSWSLDYGSEQLTWTEETYRLLGYAPESIPPSLDAFFAVVHPEDQDAVRAELAAAPQRSDGAYRIESRFRCADGIERRLLNQGRVSFDAAGQPRSLTGTTLDVTQQRQVEAELRAQRERYRLVIDHLEDLIVRTDPDGRLVFASPSYYELFDRCEAELMGQEVLSDRLPAEPAARQEAIAALRQPPYMRHSEHSVWTQRGWRWLQWVDRAMLGADGEVVGIVSLGRDITERKRAELDLMQREKIESELLEVATAFVLQQDDGLTELIDLALERIAGFTQSDRAYLFQLEPDGTRMSNTFEWVAAGITPMISHLQDLPVEPYSATMQHLTSNQPVIIPSVAELDEAWAEEREIFEFQGIQSVLLVPLMEGSHLSGFIGFDAVNSQRDWTDAEVRFLKVVANLMVGAFARERIHRDLVQSQARYDQVARLSRSVAWEIDAHGRFIYLSPVIEDLLGYRPEQVVGENFHAYLPASDRPRLKRDALKRFARREPFADLTHPLRHADGHLVWVNTNGIPVVDAQDTVTGYRGIAIDITARHQAETQLRASEARLSAIFDQAPLGIATTDRAGRFTLANRALADLLGRERGALIGMSFAEISHPDDREHELELFGQLLAGQRTSYRLTKRFIKPNGDIVWGDLRVVLIPQGEDRPSLPLGMLEDISDVVEATDRRKQLEQELAHYTRQLERLVDLSGQSLQIDAEAQGLLTLGCEGLQMDLGAFGLSDRDEGYRVRTYSAAADDQDTPPAIDQGLLAMSQSAPCIPQTITTEQLDQHQIRAGWRSALLLALPCNDPNGTTETIVLSFWSRRPAAAFSDLHRELVRLIGQRLVALILIDQAQQQMIASKERETIGHLASGIAHDFNNLLGVIDGNLQYLQSSLTQVPEDPATEEYGELIDETLSALSQATVITAGMLSLSRAGGIRITDTPLEQPLEELARILQHILPARIQLEFDVEPGVRAETNAAFLQSALLNLALNARDAMPDGGRLAIAVSQRDWDFSQRLTLGTLARGACTEVTVADTGCGMDSETMQRLFEPLFSTKAEQRGHGLGMFMVQEFVLRSGAALHVESTPNRGSVFRLLLPTHGHPAERHEDPSQGKDRACDAGPQFHHALVVDDDPRVRETVSRLLRTLGITSEVAEDGEDCLERLNLEPAFDLVLTDLAMPKMDGGELYRILSDLYPDIHVVLMTGQALSVFGVDKLEPQPIAIRKPVGLEDLRNALC